MRVGHEETRRPLRDNDPARPAPEVTFADRYTLEVGGERVELAWHGPNHSPDNIFIHFPDHDALMMIDVVNAGWVPIYNLNLSEDVPGTRCHVACSPRAPAGSCGRRGGRRSARTRSR